jgi:hypothetical protein
VAQSSDSFNASNQKQAYVSISRGKDKCMIYTDNKAALLLVVKRDQERISASAISKPKIAELEPPIPRKTRTIKTKSKDRWDRILNKSNVIEK